MKKVTIIEIIGLSLAAIGYIFSLIHNGNETGWKALLLEHHFIIMCLGIAIWAIGYQFRQNKLKKER